MILAPAVGNAHIISCRNCSHLVIEAAVEGVEEMVVCALVAVGVHDAVQVGEVAVQVHVVGILATQQKVLAPLGI